MVKNTYCSIYKRKLLKVFAWVTALSLGIFLYSIHFNYLDASRGYSLFIGLSGYLAIMMVSHLFAKHHSGTITNEDIAGLVAVGESSDSNLTLTVQSLVKVNRAVYKSDLRSILQKLTVLDENAHLDYAILTPKKVPNSAYKSQYESSIIAVQKVLGIN